VYRGKLALPSAAGIDGFDMLFETSGNPVAGWVPQDKVQALRDAIRAKL